MSAIWMRNLRLQARSMMKLDLYSWERKRIYKSLIHECDSNSSVASNWATQFESIEAEDVEKINTWKKVWEMKVLFVCR